jgi:hypothetical protein
LRITVTNIALLFSLLLFAFGARAQTTVPVINGGTGATTAPAAAANIVNGNPISPSSVSTQFLYGQTPFTDSHGNVASLGSDVSMWAFGPADAVRYNINPALTTSSTAVGSTGIHTITVGSLTGFYTNLVSVMAGPATITVDRFTNSQEFLAAATSGCPSAPPVGTYCAISNTSITANFQSTHSGTYYLDQWGVAYDRSWQRVWIAPDDSQQLETDQVVGSGGWPSPTYTGYCKYAGNAITKFFCYSTIDHLPRYYGDGTNGIRVYGSNSGSGNPGTAFYDNEVSNNPGVTLYGGGAGSILVKAARYTDTSPSGAFYSLTNHAGSQQIAGLDLNGVYSGAAFGPAAGTASTNGYYRCPSAAACVTSRNAANSANLNLINSDPSDNAAINSSIFIDTSGDVKNLSGNTIIPGTALLPYVGFKTFSGGGVPTDTCSSSVNTGAIEINATLVAYQCSNALESYAWNSIGNNGPAFVNAVDMELFPSPWGICDGTCAGGAGIPSVGPTQTFNVSSPSLNNNSTEMSFTANANSTNVLFYSEPVGAYCATCTKFTFDTWYRPTNSSGVNEHEFDQFIFTTSGSEWMFGHQCVVGGVWDIWNQFTGTWVPTAYSCSLSANTYHHLVFVDYRNASDTTGCSGYGCMYFGTLTVDGTLVYSLDQQEPAGPTPVGFTSSAAGAQVQEDVNTASVGSPVSVVSYYDLMTFTESQ